MELINNIPVNESVYLKQFSIFTKHQHFNIFFQSQRAVKSRLINLGKLWQETEMFICWDILGKLSMKRKSCTIIRLILSISPVGFAASLFFSSSTPFITSYLTQKSRGSFSYSGDDQNEKNKNHK